MKKKDKVQVFVLIAHISPLLKCIKKKKKVLQLSRNSFGNNFYVHTNFYNHLAIYFFSQNLN